LDRTSLALPGVQEGRLRAMLLKSDSPIVLVVINGGPIDISFAHAAPQVAAILHLGFPGTLGGEAIADVLTGSSAPAGRLPVTWYFANYSTQIDARSMDMRAWPGRTHRFLQVPVLYEYGYGLSYTSFVYRHLQLTPRSAPAAANRSASLEVFNAGSVASDEVVLLFSAFRPAGGPPRGGASAHPRRDLLAFRRLRAVQPGQAVQLSFDLTPADFQLTDGGGEGVRWHVPAGRWLLTTSACEGAEAAVEPAALQEPHACAAEFWVE
jgi:hypothetical protein